MDKLKEVYNWVRNKYWTLPFGNDGRGTRIYLWPFVGAGVVLAGAVILNYLIYGVI